MNYDELRQERDRQDKKWGQQDHDPLIWAAILGEETGEFTKAALHWTFGGPEAGGLREEAIQVAAVAVAIIECCDRHDWLAHTGRKIPGEGNATFVAPAPGEETTHE